MKPTALLTLGAIPLTSAWSVVYYSEPQCTGDVIAFENLTHPREKCHPPLAMEPEPQSALVSRGHVNKKGKYVYEYDNTRDTMRFYDSDDCSSHCSHQHVIAESHFWDCLSWPLAAKEGRRMASFNVVRVGHAGIGRGQSTISDGICLLQHGDRLYFRGKYWRMQQVGAAWFNEIPEEDWDPVRHKANTTLRFGRHGDIDTFAKYKLREDRGDMDEIGLQYWDEDKHYPRKSSPWTDYGYSTHYEQMLDDTYEDATRDDVDLQSLLGQTFTEDWFRGEDEDQEQTAIYL